MTAADQKKCGPFFKAINAGDISEVERMLTESPWLIQSTSLKNNPPIVVAQYSRNPSAMTALLISKRVDLNTLLHLCTKGLKPETVDALLELWSEEGQSIASLAYNSIELQLIGCLLRRVSSLSMKEKESMWNLLADNSWKNRKEIVPFALDLLESPAGRGLFEISGSSDSEIFHFNFKELGPGLECKGIFRSALTFVRFAVKNQMETLLEAMENIGPDIVRPIVFICLNDSKSSMLENASAKIHAIGKRFKRDCMWLQVRLLFLARVHDPSPMLPSGQIRLMDLPDACFRAIIEFYQEPIDKESVVKILCKGFCCSEKMMFKSCACHFHAVNRVDDYYNRVDDYDPDSGGEGGYWLNY